MAFTEILNALENNPPRMKSYEEIRAALKANPPRGKMDQMWAVALTTMNARGKSVAAGVAQMRSDIQLYSASSRKTAPAYVRACEKVIAFILG